MAHSHPPFRQNQAKSATCLLPRTAHWGSGFCALALLVACSGRVEEQAFTEDIYIAVASNFSQAATSLARTFEAESGRTVVLSFGSSGKLCSQIQNGAPFDIFLAADVVRPQLLEEGGFAIAGSRFTYAVGRLVLWSPQSDLIDPNGLVLHASQFEHLALANPDIAPYGMAARDVLQNLQLWDDLAERLVLGQNIAQALQFVDSGNAELGFIAFSQWSDEKRQTAGSHWVVPQSLHAPILQQAIACTEKDGAAEFLSYLQGPNGLGVIHSFGYEAP
ncbi:MAG: molybdate ABC transporter substrate-binding protein [Planctomycetota bacterium]